MILKRERSEEEKLRRHLHGDKGAKFSGGKIPCVDGGGIIGAITTMVTKDLLLIETYENSSARLLQQPHRGWANRSGHDDLRTPCIAKRMEDNRDL